MNSNYSKIVTEVSQSHSPTYRAYTLVDVTDSRVYDFRYSDTTEYHQFQNLSVLVQLMSFRTQPTILSVTVLDKQDLKKYQFGKKYKGKHRVWQVDFSIEPDLVWNQESDKFYWVKQDSNSVAVTVNLSETVIIEEEQFNTLDVDLVNLYFQELSSSDE